jgi:hypothetical protein
VLPCAVYCPLTPSLLSFFPSHDAPQLLGTWQEYMERKQGLRLLRRAAQKGLLDVQEEKQQGSQGGQEAPGIEQQQQQGQDERRSSGSSVGPSKAWGSSLGRARKKSSGSPPAPPASEQRVKEVAEL